MKDMNYSDQDNDKILALQKFTSAAADLLEKYPDIRVSGGIGINGKVEVVASVTVGSGVSTHAKSASLFDGKRIDYHNLCYS